MIWRSPFWMPLALGSYGDAIRIHRIAFVGAFRQGRSANDPIIPFHEEMARRIHWWQYSPESVRGMISYTP